MSLYSWMQEDAEKRGRKNTQRLGYQSHAGLSPNARSGNKPIVTGRKHLHSFGTQSNLSPCALEQERLTGLGEAVALAFRYSFDISLQVTPEPETLQFPLMYTSTTVIREQADLETRGILQAAAQLV